MHSLLATSSLVHRIQLFACTELFEPNKNQRSISWLEWAHQCFDIIIPEFPRGIESYLNMELAFKIFQPEHHILLLLSTYASISATAINDPCRFAASFFSARNKRYCLADQMGISTRTLQAER
ncbi:hypothetical protein PVAP13_2KG203501 [Panicum virgatum]|uniref:Uncharacterized protein n=1 Tax=Panicum virgatum TaxID=38727 RepID=A0A8T0WH14_PANVG|nr:hypothetical protein PVAP13_2KG203501 [Panicum virgatum]